MYYYEGRLYQMSSFECFIADFPLLTLFFYSQNINTFENRMLMLDGMPSVRVKTELLESEQGVSFQWCPTLFSLWSWQSFPEHLDLCRTLLIFTCLCFFSQVRIIWDWLILIHLQPQALLTWKRELPETRQVQWSYKNHVVLFKLVNVLKS